MLSNTIPANFRLEIVSSALSIKPLTPFEGVSLEKWPSVCIRSMFSASSSLANSICSAISSSPGIVTQKNTSFPINSLVSFASSRT